MKRDGIRIAKGLASLRTLYATLLTNNLKQLMQKEQITYENKITCCKGTGILGSFQEISQFFVEVVATR